MVTKNWYNVMKAYRAQSNLTDAAKNIYGTMKTISYYLTTDVIPTITLRPTKGLYLVSTSHSDQFSTWIIVGSGTAPATVDDYNLQSMITSGLSASLSSSVDGDNDTIYKLNITNTSSEDITIGEVGMIGPFFETNSSSFPCLALMERTVLDSPITIPAGGIGMLDYAIKIPIPTA